MSQCQVAGCLGTASATTGQCSVCSVPIECPTLGCKNVPVVLAVGCNWCPNCNRPTSARVPTQAVAHALQAHGVDWNGAQARRFAGTYVGTAFRRRRGHVLSAGSPDPAPPPSPPSPTDLGRNTAAELFGRQRRRRQRRLRVKNSNDQYL